MRIVIETDAIHAVAFTVPVAELVSSAALLDNPAIRDLGPDLLSPDFNPEDATRRLRARADVAIADALLDQRCVAGIGNVYKSEVLFLGRVDPFTPVGHLGHEALVTLLGIAARLLRANVAMNTPIRVRLRRTTPRDAPAAALWVYGRAGRPCRRCGTPVSSRKHGPDARVTYWCERCQQAPNL
jgi:endonuclease-8